ncbi:hypothetical protein P59_080 [Bacillus phage P59]|nr:hypothetical protein P59_080 [Bacillus phage P59]
MANKAIRPKLFKSDAATKSTMQQIGNVLVQKTLSEGVRAIRENPPEDEVKISRKPKYLEVTQKRLDKLGVIDLKPYFARSSHRKMKKGGGWYLTVPIARKKKNMSRRMYDQLRSYKVAEGQERVVISDYLYDRRRVSDSSMLNYTPKSYNINKKRVGKRKHTYVAYRTVSDASPANSWILNRDRVNVKDTSKTFVSNVSKLMKWKMKNGWG